MSCVGAAKVPGSIDRCKDQLLDRCFVRESYLCRHCSSSYVCACLITRCPALTKVRQNLPDLLYKLKILTSKKSLAEMAPVAIMEDGQGTKGSMSGYKEVWNCARAAQSLVAEHLYEAGGSIAWTSLALPSPVPADSPTLQQVMDFKTQFVPIELAGRSRIVWPGVVLCALADDSIDKCKDKHPAELALVGNKAVVMAWWVSCLMCCKGFQLILADRGGN